MALDDATVEFVGSVPAPVDVILGIRDCASLESAVAFWTARIEEPAVAARASAYAAAAAARRSELGCEHSTPTPQTSPSSSVERRFTSG
ncbi:hypothetical protein [Desertimonas flava]|uniref:hypothetical protein n=1 Tax=Desertimonas flava TaxID=2064846 RepID=UPI000E3481AC|nr:hypothetical protein [Desertimonas flava]